MEIIKIQTSSSSSSFIIIGLWLVANELEDPFRNVPNDIPLNNFQAQFNEALVCMFAGFHPEAWWDIDERKAALSTVQDGAADLNMDSLFADHDQSVVGEEKNQVSLLENIKQTTLNCIDESCSGDK